MCVWQSGCNGVGLVHCQGCGGDQCICVCGGERECEGCDACAAADEAFGDELADALEHEDAGALRGAKLGV
jgi:hypothetical protein